MSASPLRPSSLINTVYGAFLRRLGGWTSIADLITLMGELDVDGPAVRSAVSRLKKRGVLEPERRGATGYRLSPAVLPVFDEGDRRIFASLEPADLADGWAMAVFSVPESERSHRYQLRTRLSWLGFGNIAPGVWLAPGRLLEDARLGLSDYVHVFAAEYAAFSDLPGTVGSWWDFQAIQSQYARFTDTYAPLAARLPGCPAARLPGCPAARLPGWPRPGPSQAPTRRSATTCPCSPSGGACPTWTRACRPSCCRRTGTP
ncbi:PaaX family transcriptional regulator [Streptomyces sp. NPDC046161]|uniref:PaaX family transcriptional regulator n=1 Tax=Streptomyces sp. NPDC046161 TaxID=3155132 RepID=UPI0033ECF201